jgi:putative transposase
MIEVDHEKLSIREQCTLLGLSRASFYYRPRGANEETLRLMERIDEIHTEHITWGSRKIRDALRLEGWAVNRKRVQRLMRLMAMQVVFPKQHRVRLPVGHEVYPYLLRGVLVDRPDQVWSIDTTYIRLDEGFAYLTAIIDWYSRKILAWDLSLSLDKSSGIIVLDRALRRNGQPEVFNSDQGSQFTSPDFLAPLKERNVRISMDGKGRALDNIFIERFWRTIKYDEVYLNVYESVKEARQRIAEFIEMYNSIRPHASLDGQTPNAVYARHSGGEAA